MTTETPGEPSPRPRSRPSRPLHWVAAGLLAASLGFVAWFLVDGIEGALDALGRADAGWLLVAAAAEVGVYSALGLLLAALLLPRVRHLWLTSARTGLILYGMGTILPGAPAPGLALATVGLRKAGIEPERITLALMWCSWFIVRAFVVLVIVTAAVALGRGHVPDAAFAPTIAGAACIGLAVIGLTFVANRPWLGEQAGRLLAALPWRGGPIRELQQLHDSQWRTAAEEVLGTHAHRMVMTGASLAAWGADAICFGLAMRAVGVEPGISVLLIAYVCAMAVSLVPLLPGGIGLVEIAAPSVLHYYGVPFEAALAGTLAWRALSLVMPAAVGALALLTFQRPRLPGWAAVRLRRRAA